jgi:hypothetical protein
MANTEKTIKNATDQELNEILYRVRTEGEVLRLMRELKIKSTPNLNGPYPIYSTKEAFSTETPIKNGTSIKNMTDDELSIFFRRLENENELLRRIQEIKELNVPALNGDSMVTGGKPYEGISLDTPIKDLYHFGIPGMRWGSRRGSTSTSTGKSRRSSDYLESKSLKKKGVKNLSTAELKKLNDRTQQERTFKSLNPSVARRGQQAGKAVLAAMATVTTVYAFAASPAGKAVENKAAGILKKVLFPAVKLGG